MRAAAGLGGAALLFAACTPGAPAPAPTASTPFVSVGPSNPEPTTVASGTCPDVSGALLATDGVVSLGPFFPDELGPLPADQTGRKLWVQSKKPGPDAAVLVVTDPTGRRSQERRPEAEPQPGSDEQFFPGGLDTPVPGPYRIELTIGPDSICVVVVYG